MTELNFTYDATLAFSGEVWDQQYVLRCLPVRDAAQTVLAQSLSVTPGPPPFLGVDGFGNTVVTGSILAPHSSFACHSAGLVRVCRPQNLAGGYTPALRYPGALTKPDTALQAFFASLPGPGAMPSPYAWCAQLSRAVSDHFTYLPGVTGVNTTAAAAFRQQSGVCQDYAQVFLTLARLAGYPARYCMGLAVGEGATHAWAEVCLPGIGWQGFDPTRGCTAGEEYLLFGTGRDAADCPAERGVLRGNVGQTQTVFMRCEQEKSQ